MIKNLSENQENQENSQKAVAADSKVRDLESLMKKVNSAIDQKKYHDAKFCVQEIFMKFPDLPKKEKSDLLAISAEISYWLGEYAAAKQDGNLALQLNPKNSAAHLVLGKIALAEYFFTKAKGHFMSANDQDPAVQLALCRLYIKLRDIRNARMHLIKASHLLPAGSLEFDLLQNYLAILESNKSVSAKKQGYLIQSFEGNPDCMIILAELYITAGEYAQAKGVLSRLLVVCPENDQVQGLLAQCALAEEDYAGANQSAENALRRNPFNAFALTVSMKVASKYGDYNLAESIGKRILAQSPEYILAHANLGDVYFLQGRYDLAVNEYQAANELMQTETKGSKLRKARLLIMNRDYQAACGILENLLDSQGMFYDDALCDLMLTYSALGEEEKKQELIQRLEMRKIYSRRIERMLECVYSGKTVEKI